MIFTMGMTPRDFDGKIIAEQAEEIRRLQTAQQKLVTAAQEILEGVEPDCMEPDCPDCGPWRSLRSAVESTLSLKKCRQPHAPVKTDSAS